MKKSTPSENSIESAAENTMQKPDTGFASSGRCSPSRREMSAPPPTPAKDETEGEILNSGRMRDAPATIMGLSVLPMK